MITTDPSISADAALLSLGKINNIKRAQPNLQRHYMQLDTQPEWKLNVDLVTKHDNNGHGVIGRVQL